jgi:hypothetical protein
VNANRNVVLVQSASLVLRGIGFVREAQNAVAATASATAETIVTMIFTGRIVPRVRRDACPLLARTH